jgi:NAD+ synthase
MKTKEKIDHIVGWLRDYAEVSGRKVFVVGISGGIDSAVTSALCCLTGNSVYALNMPLESYVDDRNLAMVQSGWLVDRFYDVRPRTVVLDKVFREFRLLVDHEFLDDHAFANSKSRMRMVVLYQVAGSVGGLVVGTGNRVEDFGVGFFTKYGDGGVDLSPIADLYKSEVYELGEVLEIDRRILDARPTDGLWLDGRTDEDQLGMSYSVLERCMKGGEDVDSEHMDRFRELQKQNRHKMESIPVCLIPRKEI